MKRSVSLGIRHQIVTGLTFGENKYISSRIIIESAAPKVFPVICRARD